MNTRLVFQSLVLLCALEVTCQKSMRVSGQIVDQETKEPLAFSTISIMGTPKGVVSNFLGSFEFSFSEEHAKDTLYFSMLGYQPKRIPINQLKNGQGLDIQLQESIVVLDEVSVSEKKLSALDIVTKVIEEIPSNYPTEPYLLKGFTRSHKHECGQYLKLYEAAFEVYGGGYHKKTPEKIYINEARQSQEVPYYHSRVIRSNSNPFNAMGHINDVLFRSNSLKLNFNRYVIDKIIEEDGDLIYVIKTNHSAHVTHTMYIHADSYALLKVKMEMGTPDSIDWNPLLNKGVSSDSLNFKVTRVSKTIQFEEKKGRYFAKYMDWLIAGDLTYKETEEEFCEWGFRFETMFDEVITQNVAKPSKDRLLNFRSVKEPQSTKYNPKFWEEYSLTKDFPITPQIISDLEKNGKLEEQYKEMARSK